MTIDQSELDKAEATARERNASSGVDLVEFTSPGKLGKAKTEPAKEETTQPETKDVVEPEVKPKKKTKRKAKKKPVAETQPATEPAEETVAASDDTETTTDTEVDNEGGARKGPRERAELKYQAELEALRKQLNAKDTLLDKEHKRRVSIERQLQEQGGNTNTVAEFANNSLTKYRDGLKKAIDSDAGGYLDVNGNEIDKQSAIRMVNDVDDYLKTTSVGANRQQEFNPYDDPSLPLQSKFEQSSVEYSQRLNLSQKFADRDYAPEFVEELAPVVVQAISSLDEDDQQLIVAGLGDKFTKAEHSKKVREELLELGNDWYSSKDPYELVSKINRFKVRYADELIDSAEEDDEEVVVAEIKPGGKPTAGSQGAVPKHQYTGTTPGDDEDQQAYYDRRQKEMEEAAAKRYGLRV